jgi:O-antigen/teichoic acid export membrane protein
MAEDKIERGSVSRVGRSGVLAFGIFAIGAVLTYCAQLLIARLVGADTYGIYAYVLAWMTVGAYFSALGFDVALLRIIPTYQEQGAGGLIKGVIRYAQSRVLAVGLAVVAIGALASLLGPKWANGELNKTLLVGVWLVPLLAILWLRCSVLRSYGMVALPVASDRVVRDGVLIALVFVAAKIIKRPVDAQLLMILTVVGACAGLALASYALREIKPLAGISAAPAYDTSSWLTIAAPLLVIGAAEILLNRTGILYLGWTGDARNAGIYSLVFNISFVVALPRTAINTRFAPMLAGVFARDDKAVMQDLVNKSAAWSFGAATAIACVMWIFAEPILSWFGRDFVAGAPALRILLAGQVFAASTGSQLYIMTMTGHERSAAAMLVAWTTANIVLTAIIASLYGLTGAAIATAVTLVAWNIGMMIYIWRRLNIWPGLLGAARTLRYGPLQAAPPAAPESETDAKPARALNIKVV